MYSGASRTRRLALVATALLITAPAFGQSRRAILVGISNYNPTPAEKRAAGPAKPSRADRPRLTKDPRYWKCANLRRPPNDLTLVRTTLENLGVTDFLILRDQEATADAILSSLQKDLVDDARPGDVRVFYFSGYGNAMRNTASANPSAPQPTLVPADHWRGVPDITTNELRRIFFRAAQKGVRITAIIDSTLTHDPSSPRSAKEPALNEPENRDSSGKPIDPDALGVLTLAASELPEPALEIDVQARTPDPFTSYGAFTYALAHSISSPRQPVQEVFQRTIGALRKEGVLQNPVMAGAGRSDKGIFGDPADVQR